MKNNLCHYYYGYGKGKTTASMGAAARMIGAGGTVLIVSFLKDGTSSELSALRSLGAVTFVPWDSKKFWGQMSQEEQKQCIDSNNECLDRLKDEHKWDLMILDEAATAFSMGCLERKKLLELLKFPPCEVIVTGHEYEADISENCQYVTEMRCVKHPYNDGLTARKGIEY